MPGGGRYVARARRHVRRWAILAIAAAPNVSASAAPASAPTVRPAVDRSDRRKRGDQHRDERDPVREAPAAPRRRSPQPVDQRRTVARRAHAEREHRPETSRQAERCQQCRPHERMPARHRGHRHDDERPVTEIGEDPGSEADPVQERRDVGREERAPPIRHLPAELRHRHRDPELARDVQARGRCDERDPGNAPRGTEQRTRGCEQRAEHGGGCGRPGGVHEDRYDPPVPVAPVDHGGDGLHHRKASGTEQARDPGDDRGHHEREAGRLAQHRTFSSR